MDPTDPDSYPQHWFVRCVLCHCRTAKCQAILFTINPLWKSWKLSVSLIKSTHFLLLLFMIWLLRKIFRSKINFLLFWVLPIALIYECITLETVFRYIGGSLWPRIMNNELLNAFEAETEEQWMFLRVAAVYPCTLYTFVHFWFIYTKNFLSFWRLADENAALPFPLRVLCLHAE